MAGMVAALDSARPDSSLYLHGILEAPEHPELRRLTALVEYLFRVPVAYVALLGHGNHVVARVGTGTEYAACLGALRLDNLLGEPQVVRDSARDLPAGTDLRDLRFAASALLRSTTGVQFGVLVIAGREPRPDFSAADVRALAGLAAILSGKMELRLVASLALESELSLRETEDRFRGIAHFAPVPLLYTRSDGACVFVNQAWLDFSGRTAEEEQVKGWASLVHPEYRKRVVEESRRAFDTHVPFTSEAPLRRYDGVYRWVLGKGAPKFRRDGSFDGYVGCLIDLGDSPGPMPIDGSPRR